MILISRITGDAYAPFGTRTVYKGGGGGTTTTSGIDAEFKHDLQAGLGISRSLLQQQQADPSTVVAGLTPQQQQALTAQAEAGQAKMAGTGIYDTAAQEQAALQKLAGQNLQAANAGGFLGSARSTQAIASALAGRAGEYQQQRQQMADQGIAQLGQAGTTLQQQQQAELEARDTSLDRFFNRLTGAAPKETTVTGGGK